MLKFANARAQVIGHNYVGNQPILYWSERMDSWEDEDENCSLDYFISAEFGGDNTNQSMNVKNMCTKQ